MKLFDQNLSLQLPKLLVDLFADSVHIRVGLHEGSDSRIWEYAKLYGFTIVSKNADQQRSLLYGSPPKFVWLRVGNCPVKTTRDLLREHAPAIHLFGRDASKSYLMLP